MAVRVAVAVARGDGVRIAVSDGVGVAVAVWVEVAVAVNVADEVGDGVAVFDGIGVGDAVAVGDGVAVDDGVTEAIARGISFTLPVLASLPPIDKEIITLAPCTERCTSPLDSARSSTIRTLSG